MPTGEAARPASQQRLRVVFVVAWVLVCSCAALGLGSVAPVWAGADPVHGVDLPGSGTGLLPALWAGSTAYASAFAKTNAQCGANRVTRPGVTFARRCFFAGALLLLACGGARSQDLLHELLT